MRQFPQFPQVSQRSQHQTASRSRFARPFRPAVLALGLLALALPGARAEVIPLNYMDARDAAGIINALYSNEVRAVAFPPTNALLVNMTPSGAATQAAMPAGPRQLPAGPAFGNPYGTPYGTPYGRVPFGQPNPPGAGPGYGPAGTTAPQISVPPMPAPQTPAAPAVPATPMNNPEAPPTS